MSSVVVSNAVGSITSANATLTVPPRPRAPISSPTRATPRAPERFHETRLTANVNASTFGKLHFLATDGKVDAQPLYLSALDVGGATQNVVFTATENDSVYAFERIRRRAVEGFVGSARRKGQRPGQLRSSRTGGRRGRDAVINRATGTIYVIAMTVASNGKTYYHRLHALSLTTGAEMFGGPSEITAPSPRAPARSLDPRQNLERSGRLLLNGTIYTAWTSNCENKTPTGDGLQREHAQADAVLNVAPNSGGVGPAIWSPGAASPRTAAGICT